MDKLNSKFYDYLQTQRMFGPVVPLSHNRYKVSCLICEESFNNPRIHVLRKHLDSAKHAARSSVRPLAGLTKKEIVQRNKLLAMFTFLRFAKPYLVCAYCDLVFSCGASPSMIANHEKCRKHQDLKEEYFHKYEKKHFILENQFEHIQNSSTVKYPGVIFFSTKEGQVFKLDEASMMIRFDL